MTSDLAPMPISLTRFAWRVAGVREVVINLVINSLICTWVFWHPQEIPLWGWGGIISVLGPMSYLLPWLTTFFGVFSGVMSRRSGYVSPPLARDTPWLTLAIVKSTIRALLITTATWTFTYWLSLQYPNWMLSKWLVVIGLSLGSALVAYGLHGTAILSTRSLK